LLGLRSQAQCKSKIIADKALKMQETCFVLIIKNK